MTIHTIRRILRKCCLCQEKRDDCQWYEPLKGFLCPRCTMNPQPYSVANATRIGHPLKHLPAFSLEFEVSSCNQSALGQALILLKYQYKRTSDGTVDDEYKSPIYHSLRSFRKLLPILHEMRELVNERCGTHLHVACAQKERLHEVQSEVFSPLLDHMLTHREQTIQFWGRFFSRFASAPILGRYHCFNLESSHPTLEFRLPRFRSAEQYLRVVRCCRAIVAYLDKALAEGQPAEDTPNPPHGQENVIKKRTASPVSMGKHVLALYIQYVKTLPDHETWLEQEVEQEDQEEDREEDSASYFDDNC